MDTTVQSITVQSALIDKVKKLVPKSVSLVDELSIMLEISTDSVYRRLRGETQLTIQEVEKLCTTYNISFDALCSEAHNRVTFAYRSLENMEECELYLDSILTDLKKLKASGKGYIQYTAIDIPIFHNFLFPQMSSFKIYYWLKSVINEDAFMFTKYSHDKISPNIINIAQDIYKAYQFVPSTEVWNSSTISSLLKQILYVWESGMFDSKEEAVTLCEQIKEYLKILHRQAEWGTKLVNEDTKVIKDDYQLYASDIYVGNNCILVSVEDNKSVYLSNNTFSKIHTNDTKFYDNSEKWMNNIKKKSTLISGVGEKQRQQFFQKAFEKVDTLHRTIEKSF